MVGTLLAASTADSNRATSSKYVTKPSQVVQLSLPVATFVPPYRIKGVDADYVDERCE